MWCILHVDATLPGYSGLHLLHHSWSLDNQQTSHINSVNQLHLCTHTLFLLQFFSCCCPISLQTVFSSHNSSDLHTVCNVSSFGRGCSLFSKGFGNARCISLKDANPIQARAVGTRCVERAHRALAQPACSICKLNTSTSTRPYLFGGGQGVSVVQAENSVSILGPGRHDGFGRHLRAGCRECVDYSALFGVAMIFQ